VFARLRTRLLLSSVVTVAIVLGLLAFILLIQLRFNQRVQMLNQLRTAAASARELSLYTQYNAHDTNAYALGHLEHRSEFEEHAAAFISNLEQLERSVAAGVLGQDARSQIEQIRSTRLKYDQASQALFAAADTQRSAPSAANQAAADSTWETADQLGDQLDEESQALSRSINADIEQLLPDVSVANQQIIISVLILGSLLIGLLLFVQIMAGRAVGAPLENLLAGVRSFAAGNLGTRIAVRRQDEIGNLAEAFNGMAARLQEQQQTLAARNQELQHSLSQQQQLFSTVQQLSAPLLPIGNGVLLLPIVGHVDAARAESILQTLLHGVASQRAYCAILDVTGIAVMDAQTLQLLLQMVEATELLGAQVLMAGISGAMAQVIVAQELDVGRLRTYRDLGSAIEAARSRRAATNGLLVPR
jgi:anti-anti-sigma regulatory factor/HAMP domain-containing protein